jgi:flagellar M-ring protein FliF
VSTDERNGGVALGAAAGFAVPTDSLSGTTGSDVLKQNETINYEVSKAVRHVVNPVGKVERMSVAVVIDNFTKTTIDNSSKQEVVQEPRSSEEMNKYRELVAAAIGFNPSRGDQLTVKNISFQGETELIDKPSS